MLPSLLLLPLPTLKLSPSPLSLQSLLPLPPPSSPLVIAVVALVVTAITTSILQSPPLLVKFDVQNITFNKKYFEHHPGERSKCSIVAAAAAAAAAAATVATIATVANDIGSQKWQWWGQAMAPETEAVAGGHNNQPTDGSDSNRNCVFGGGSGDGGSRGSSSGNGGNCAATAGLQTVAAATAAREIYIKKGWKRRSWRRWRQHWRQWRKPLQPQRRCRLR